MRVLPTLMVVCILAIGVSGKPHKRTDSDTRKSDQGSAVSIGANNYNPPSEQSEHTNSDPPKWYTPLKRPEWWLVGAAFVTLYVIWRQTRATEAATQSMNRSIGLQEAALQQWVNVVNWRTEFFPTTPTTQAALGIKIDIVNETTFPLTVKSGHIVFGRNTTFHLAGDFFMTPKNPYTVDFAYYLSQEEVMAYLDKGIWFEIRGDMSHVGCWASCSRNRFVAI